MVASGVALAFFGRRLVPFALVLSALVIGFLHGGSLLLKLTENPGVLRFGPVVLSILLAVLVSFLYKTAFFVAGLLIGFFASSALFPELPLLYAGVIAIIAGALVYVSRNFVFSVLTSIMGAGLTAAGAVNLLAWLNVSAGVTAYWTILAVITTAGLLFQNKRPGERK
ncbi:MAG: hypothetical protein KAH54_05680 [Candidatus Sabulitectum sp.]|nr:hypothetical protein [Candidatus Sabulitectum sp.]